MQFFVNEQALIDISSKSFRLPHFRKHFHCSTALCSSVASLINYTDFHIGTGCLYLKRMDDSSAAQA